MPVRRHSHGCGLVNNPNQGLEVVVAGGYQYGAYRTGYSDTADIFTINTDTWRAGKMKSKPKKGTMAYCFCYFQQIIFQKLYMVLLRSLTKIALYSSGVRILA